MCDHTKRRPRAHLMPTLYHEYLAFPPKQRCSFYNFLPNGIFPPFGRGLDFGIQLIYAKIQSINQSWFNECAPPFFQTHMKVRLSLSFNIPFCFSAPYSLLCWPFFFFLLFIVCLSSHSIFYASFRRSFLCCFLHINRSGLNHTQ